MERTSCYGVAGDALTCLISEQSLTLYELLGNGAFGYVRRGKWVKDSRKKVIIVTFDYKRVYGCMLIMIIWVSVVLRRTVCDDIDVSTT